MHAALSIAICVRTLTLQIQTACCTTYVFASVDAMMIAHYPMNAHRCVSSCVDINCTNVTHMQGGIAAGCIWVAFAGCNQLSLQQGMQQPSIAYMA